MSVLELAKTHREQACQLFRSAQNEDLLRGRSIEAMAAASVYAACRCTGHPLPQGDVVEAARVEGGRVMNAYSVLNEDLGLPAQPMRPRAFLARFSSDLDLPVRIRRRAESLAERATERISSVVPIPGSPPRACTPPQGRLTGGSHSRGSQLPSVCRQIRFETIEIPSTRW